jgi:hypothetical protein
MPAPAKAATIRRTQRPAVIRGWRALCRAILSGDRKLNTLVSFLLLFFPLLRDVTFICFLLG